MAEPKKSVSETLPTGNSTPAGTPQPKDKKLTVEVQVSADTVMSDLGVPMERIMVLGEVAAERQRQIEKGYDAAHDDSHAAGTLVHGGYERFRMLGTYPPDDARRKALVQMAALIVAEIERTDRALASGETVAVE